MPCNYGSSSTKRIIFSVKTPYFKTNGITCLSLPILAAKVFITESAKQQLKQNSKHHGRTVITYQPVLSLHIAMSLAPKYSRLQGQMHSKSESVNNIENQRQERLLKRDTTTDLRRKRNFEDVLRFSPKVDKLSHDMHLGSVPEEQNVERLFNIMSR